MVSTEAESRSLKEVLEALRVEALRDEVSNESGKEIERILILGCHPSRPKHAFEEMT